MKIKELIYETPEMSEERLLEIMNNHLNWIRRDFKDRIFKLHFDPDKPYDLAQSILDEYDLIQDKKSLLSRSQREMASGFVSACMILMAKDNEKKPTEGS